MIQGLKTGNEQAVIWAFSLYFILVASYSLFFQVRSRQWPSVWGEPLTEEVGVLIPDHVASERDYRVRVLYRYSVADQVYEGHRLSPWVIVASHNARLVLQQQMKGITRNDKGQVKVFFNPRNPQKSYLILPGYFGMVLTLMLGLFPMWLYVLKYGL